MLTRGWARGLYPHPIAIRDVLRVRAGVGIYMACRADGELLYVGSAARPTNLHGVGHRICEHSSTRRSRWRYVWILPLYDDTPPKIVLAIEGQVIDVLKPLQNQRRHTFRIVPIRESVAEVYPDSKLLDPLGRT